MASEFLFLCDQLSGYLHGCIVRLADSVTEARITVVAKPGSKQAPFNFAPHPAITILDRSKLVRADFRNLVASRPRFALIAGWRDHDYRWTGRQLRGSCPVVLASDNLWKGTLKQFVVTQCFSGFIRRFASHMWIPGLYQFEYARRLGFPRDRILTGIYTATSDRYDAVRHDSRRSPSTKKTILFVGNVWEAKGVRELVDAFRSIETERPDWNLKIIGDGPLRSTLADVSPRIEWPGFIQPAELAREFVDASLFCLPSYSDQWGVVIHEACCAGLPVVATNVCGAITAFVHDGYNGFRCEPRSTSSLRRALEKVMDLPETTRELFGQRSRELSRQITLDMWVSKVLSTLEGFSRVPSTNET